MTFMELKRRTDCGLDQSGEAFICSVPKGDSWRSSINAFMKKFGFTRAENQHKLQKPLVSLARRRTSHSLRDLHFYFNVWNIFHLSGAIPSLSLKAIPLDGAHLQNSWFLGVRMTGANQFKLIHALSSAGLKFVPHIQIRASSSCL